MISNKVMESVDKARITENLSTLSAKTTWNDALEASLLEQKIFSKALLQAILVINNSAFNTKFECK